mgnify:CR=1 FL=1
MPDKKNEDGGAILTPEDFDSTRNTELAACLITLGFSRVIGEGIAGPGGAVTWWFGKRSRDGKYTMGEVLARWEDWDWLNDPNNLDPLAYIITGFHNKRRLVDEVKKREVMVLVQSGARHALFSKNCSRSTLDRVERFMGF